MLLPYSHRCIRGLLKDKIVILVTHQVQFALEADKLLGLKEVGYINLGSVCSVQVLDLYRLLPLISD